MKRQIQKTGVRTYFGDDLIDLQTQPLAAIDAILATAGQCVISGCELTQNGDKYDVAPGYVALNCIDQATDALRIMVMPFGGVAGVTLPVYLTASVDVVERAYGDGAVKPIAYSYNAMATAIQPIEKTSIEITTTYTRRLADAMAESVTKYIAVTTTEKTAWNAKETAVGAQAKANTAKADAIAAAATDATTKANTAKAEAKSDAIATAKSYTDNSLSGKAATNHNHDVATTAADGFMTKGDKTKLNGIAAGANAYVHPSLHSISQVSGLQTALDGKVNATSNNGMDSRRQNSASSYDATMVGPDGIVFMRGRTPGQSQLPVSITYEGINVPYNGAFSIPGALLWAGCNGNGSVDFYEGSKKHTLSKITKQSQGVYRIYHSIGHVEYTVAVAIYSPDGWCGLWHWRNQNTTYIDIVICGTDSQPADRNFMVTLTGRN